MVSAMSPISGMNAFIGGSKVLTPFVLQRLDAFASCVLDRTAPICVCILGRSSTDLAEQQCILKKCRDKLVESNIDSGPELLLRLNAFKVMEFSSQEQLLEHFFDLNEGDIGKALSTRLKCNTSSEIMALPSVVKVFFEQSAENTIDECCDTESSQDNPELDLPICRMKSNDPILSKNQPSVSAYISAALKGGTAVRELPNCDFTTSNDEVGSFHVEIDPFARGNCHSGSWEHFGGAKDSDDHIHGGDYASR
jgi:hypothetical protein